MGDTGEMESVFRETLDAVFRAGGMSFLGA
jgi:hypothetical protein